MSGPAADPSPVEGTGNPVPAGRSDLDIAVAMFLRRPLAVAGAIALALFFAAAAWAPVLANDRPLRFVGVDRGAATQAWRVAHLECRGLAGGLADGDRTVAQARESVEVVRGRLQALALWLPESMGPAVDRTLEDLEAAAAAMEAGLPADPGTRTGKRPVEAARFRAVATAVVSALEPGADVPLREVSRWPALDVLDGIDIALLVLPISILLAWPLLLRRGARLRRPMAFAVAALVPALLAGFAWTAAGGAATDATDWAGGLEKNAIVARVLVMAPVPWGINQNDLAAIAQAPSSEHLLGTDENGRDLLARLLWGSRVSLSVGFFAVGIYVFIGVVVGSVAGYMLGWVDIVVSRIVECVICFPVFFLILVIVAFLRDRQLSFRGVEFEAPQLLVIMLVIGVTGWTGVSRLVRAEFLRLKSLDFVMAARALGASGTRTIFRHILPNAMAPVLVAATFGVAGAILVESSLSFLGLGITVPRPSWGGMLFSARGYEHRSVWLFLWPGLAIFTVITCYNLVGEAVRDAMDPRLRR
jgi:peptide/nickel transport system permease protein